MIIKQINKYDAVEFTQKYHYAPVMPRITKHYLGMFHNDELVAVTTLGWGTRPLHTISKFFEELNSDHYFEIGKQCVHPDMPKNTGTQLLSLVCKWIKENYPHKLFLYTMADGIMGKTGIQYQAANFYYAGSFITQVYMVNGEKCHPRSVRPLLEDNAKQLGVEKLSWLKPAYMLANDIQKIQGLMFRYWMPLSKKANKMIQRRQPDWRKSEYPKDVDLAWWDMTAGRGKITQIEQPSFTWDDPVFNKRNIESHKSAQVKVTDFE